MFKCHVWGQHRDQQIDFEVCGEVTPHQTIPTDFISKNNKNCHKKLDGKNACNIYDFIYLSLVNCEFMSILCRKCCPSSLWAR